MDILLVDDNLLMQQLMARYLGDLGYSVAITSCAAEAVDRARQEPPALLVIDMHLPDLDGHDALLALRTIPGCATTPAIAMSGMGESESQHLLKSGFAAYLPKPIDLDILEATIARHFSGHKATV